MIAHCESGDERMRLNMAGAIFQGISADPELFLNRMDLLSAYSMIEHVFIDTDREGHAAYSPLGQRHVQLLKEYGALMDRLIPSFCVTISRVSGRLTAAVLRSELYSGCHPISSSTWRSKP